MELRFPITIDVPETEAERASVRKVFVSLAAELIRVAAQIDGNPKQDRAMVAVADVLKAITTREL